MIILNFLYDQISFDDKMVCYYDELPLWSSPFGILLLNNIPFQKNSIFREVLCDLKLNYEINSLNNHIKKRHSIDDIKALVNRGNLSIKKIVQENYVIRFVDGSSFFNHYFIKLVFLQDWKEIIKKDNWDKVFLNLENRLNNIANKKGEIIFNVSMAYIECEK